MHTTFVILRAYSNNNMKIFVIVTLKLYLHIIKCYLKKKTRKYENIGLYNKEATNNVFRLLFIILIGLIKNKNDVNKYKIFRVNITNHN